MSKRNRDDDHARPPNASYEPRLKRTKVARVSRKHKKVVSVATESKLTFLELPGELRNAIYAYCLTSDDGKVDIHRVMDDDTKHRTKPMRQVFNGGKKKYKDISHQLLRTCKQINKEATPILYSENVFSFHNIQDLASFCGRHATRVAHIRKITISTEVCLDGTQAALRSLETSFSLLAFAENLVSLKLNLFSYTNRDIHAATRAFYHVARNWMDAVAIRKKNKMAAVEMISSYYSSSILSLRHFHFQGLPDQADVQFRNFLRKLLMD